MIRQRVLRGRALAALGNAQRVFALEARAPPVFGLQRAAHLRHKRQRVARARKCAAHPAYLCGKRVHNLGLIQKYFYFFGALPHFPQGTGCLIIGVKIRPYHAIPFFQRRPGGSLFCFRHGIARLRPCFQRAPTHRALHLLYLLLFLRGKLAFQTFAFLQKGKIFRRIGHAGVCGIHHIGAFQLPYAAVHVIQFLLRLRGRSRLLRLCRLARLLFGLSGLRRQRLFAFQHPLQPLYFLRRCAGCAPRRKKRSLGLLCKAAVPGTFA